jgi:hypothetical protein
MNRFVIILFVLGPCVLTTGCGTPSLDTRYGTQAGASVNGTNVLIALFQERGYQATVRTTVTPYLMEATDVAVWTPHNLPQDEEIDWFNRWVRYERGRVFVFIGPDYDAAPWYWRKVQASAPIEEQPQIVEKLAHAEEARKAHQATLADGQDGGWFLYEKRPATAKTSIGAPIRGMPEWTRGINERALEIDLVAELTPPLEADILFAIDGVPVVTRQPVLAEGGGLSHVIIINNGSFLLNMPLVQPEHRKLAARLLDEVGLLVADHAPTRPASQPVRIAFFEGDSLTILEDDSERPDDDTWAMLTQAPLSYLFLQMALVGLLYAFYCWPIAGRPRELRHRSLADFGRHIEAYGALLERTGKRDYAERRVRDYYQHVRESDRASGH